MVYPAVGAAISAQGMEFKGVLECQDGHPTLPSVLVRRKERHRVRIGIHCTVIGPVCIGNNVNLAQGITVTALNHNFEDTSMRIDEQGISTKPVIISDDVWIGANAVILPGVTIGRHSVVAAGAVVTKDVPDNSLVAGIPAKVIRQLTNG